MELSKKLKLDELSERDRIIASIGGVVLVVAIVYFVLSFFIFSPLTKEKVRYEKNLSVLKELKQIESEFNGINEKYGRFISSLPPRGTDISSMILRISRSANIEANVGDMKPLSRRVGDFKELSLKFTVDGINTEELVNFLSKIENYRNFIYIDELEIQPKSSKDMRFLKAVIKVKTYIQEKS